MCERHFMLLRVQAHSIVLGEFRVLKVESLGSWQGSVRQRASLEERQREREREISR